MRLRTWSLLVLATLAPSSARTAVTAVAVEGNSGHRLDVSSAGSGPWGPHTAMTSSEVLNPNGDLLGDGFPGYGTRGTSLLVAWSRPTGPELRIALSDGERWIAQGGMATDSPVIGSPVVHGLNAGWLVLTRHLGPDGLAVRAVGLSPAGMIGLSVPAAAGHLITSAVVNSHRVVVATESDGLVQLTWLGGQSDLPLEPIPIERVGGSILGRALGHQYNKDSNGLGSRSPTPPLTLGGSDILLTLSDDGWELGVTVLGQDTEYVALPAELTPADAPKVDLHGERAKLTWERPDGKRWKLELDAEGIRKELKVEKPKRDKKRNKKR